MVRFLAYLLTQERKGGEGGEFFELSMQTRIWAVTYEGSESEAFSILSTTTER